jgi:hypothetical protein
MSSGFPTKVLYVFDYHQGQLYKNLNINGDVVAYTFKR